VKKFVSFCQLLSRCTQKEIGSFSAVDHVTMTNWEMVCHLKIDSGDGHLSFSCFSDEVGNPKRKSRGDWVELLRLNRGHRQSSIELL